MRFIIYYIGFIKRMKNPEKTLLLIIQLVVPLSIYILL